MSTHTHLSVENGPVAVAYNNQGEPMGRAASMNAIAKNWEGQVVDGQFKLLQYLGGSDHSAVFLAQRTEPKTVIKLIPTDPESDELQLARWNAAAALAHPHLLCLFQTGHCEFDGARLLYLVMEYAEEDLSQILPQRPLTPEETREMLLPVVSALGYIHQNGLVHGHLKPSNIMAAADVLRISSDGVRAAGEPIGRAISPYDPPEATGGKLSPAGDVWSLGMMLVETLTQHLPVWNRTEPGDPVLPNSLPAPFFEIARHCLRRNPAERWTVAQIAEHLQPLPVAPRQTAVAPPKAPSANRWRYAIPIVAAALALAVFAGTRMRTSPPSPDRSVHPSARQERQPLATQPAAERAEKKQQAKAGVAPAAPARSESVARPREAAFAQGAVIHRVLPKISPGARNTIQGKIRVTVRVAVDASGNVTRASLDSAGPSKYFARVAREAAQDWKFTPAKANGQSVASEWILPFLFARTGTEVSPLQITP
jgi:TonB family protein